MSTIWSWLTQTWNALALYIAHDWLFYVLAVPVVAAIAWFTLPYFKPPFEDDKQ
jgi:hypothetical protein